MAANVALTLGAVVLGGGITWAASAYGAGRESRDEHKRWLRDRRLEAWVDFLDWCSRAGAESLKMGDRQDLIAISDLLVEGLTVGHRVELLGPSEVVETMKVVLARASDFLEHHDSTHEEATASVEAWAEPMTRLTAAMQSALG